MGLQGHATESQGISWTDDEKRSSDHLNAPIKVAQKAAPLVGCEVDFASDYAVSREQQGHLGALTVQIQSQEMLLPVSDMSHLLYREWNFWDPSGA